MAAALQAATAQPAANGYSLPPSTIAGGVHPLPMGGRLPGVPSTMGYLSQQTGPVPQPLQSGASTQDVCEQLASFAFSSGSTINPLFNDEITLQTNMPSYEIARGKT